MKRVRTIRIDVWFPTVVVGAVLLLSALGISGSSLTMMSPSGAPDESSIVAGSPRPIRSDEWLAWSPMKIGIARADFPDARSYGMGTVDLSDSWRPQLPSRSLGAALFSPFNLPLVVLPLDQGFTLFWWLPFAACSLGIYAWLRAMRIGAGIALAAALFVTTAPAAVWWSGWPVQITASAVIPCAVLVAATRLARRRRRLAMVVAAGAGLAAASLPWFYQPWALPCALFFGATTLLWGLSDRDHRRRFVTLGLIAGSVFAVEQALYLLHEHEYYQALQNTAYPGRRRSDGGGVNLGLIFSSLFPFLLSRDKGGTLIGINGSEVSMGWTIFAPLTAVIAVLGRHALWRDRQRLLLVGVLAIAAVLTSWCLVRWPTIIASATGLRLIPAGRMAPLVGTFWVVGFAIVMGTEERRRALRSDIGRSGAIVVVLVTTFFAAWGATEFRKGFLTEISDLRAWLPVLMVALVVAVFCTRYWAYALGAAVAFSVLSGVIVNPLIRGTAALDDSRAAQVVRRVDERRIEPQNGRWASDNLYANALLNGQGANSLTSFNDPVDMDGWRILDPSGARENKWNRYAYITFLWDPSVTRPKFDLPSDDWVRVRIDPCDPRLSRLRLRAVLSSTPLDAPCLSERARFLWSGQRYTVYDRSARDVPAS
ncbi:MAG: hypothetical protein ACKOA9_07360 [Actinomycetota bacterium]